MRSIRKYKVVGFVMVLSSLWGGPVTASQETRVVSCRDSSSAEVVLKIERAARVYNLEARTGQKSLFRVANQRPSLNVAITDDSRAPLSEYLDFNPDGLVVVPVDAAQKLKISLADGAESTVTFRNDSQEFTLTCDLRAKRWLQFFGLNLRRQPVELQNVRAVGFDIDDTLLFNSPAFQRALASGGTPQLNDVIFWTQANSCDPGCPEAEAVGPGGRIHVLPANPPSAVKNKARELVRKHLAMGHKVYAITGRPDIEGDVLRRYVERELGIPASHVYFEPETEQPGNPSGKTDRIESLDLDLYYGDSDSDITDTLKAFANRTEGERTRKVIPIRFLRSPLSNNRKAGELNRYHPGYYGELILEGSY